MDLQNIFYIFAIVCLSLGIVFFILGIAVLWKIFDTIRFIPRKIEDKISALVESKFAVFIGSICIPLVPLLVKKIKNSFKKN